jgi:hypothetical protein
MGDPFKTKSLSWPAGERATQVTSSLFYPPKLVIVRLSGQPIFSFHTKLDHPHKAGDDGVLFGESVQNPTGWPALRRAMTIDVALETKSPGGFRAELGT